jgi:glycosyltransferase involved in cell wall biosynthesis
MTRPRSPLDALVIGWFPAVDDASAGRFIADQVAALAAGGRVRPRVVAWENLPLFGDVEMRTAQADAATHLLEGGLAHGGEPWVTPGAFGPPGIPVARIATLAGETATTGSDHQATHRWASLRALLDRDDTLAGGPPDLVHGHVGYPEGLAAAWAAEHLGRPFVLTEHASYLAKFFDDPALRDRYAAAAARASRIVAVSRMLAGELTDALPDLGDRVVVIPNAVAVDDFRTAPLAERDPDELLWVGYRKAAKGIDTLLAALRIIRASRPSTRLRLVGRSSTVDEEASWVRLASELGVADAVTFEPPADRAGVAAAMGRATVFVHPSTRETFGVVAAEALAAGLPVVACDSGGVTDILGTDPGAIGALVPHSDPAALAAAILGVLARRETFDPEALRRFAVDRFGAAAVATRIADLYEEVLDEWAVGRGPGGGRPRVAVPVPRNAGTSARASAQANAPTPAPSGHRAPVASVGALPTVLVAFLRGQLDRALAELPVDLAASLTVATVGTAPPGVGRVVIARPDTGRQIAALLDASAASRGGGWRGRLRAARRSIPGRRDRLARAVLADLRSATVRAIETARTHSGPDAPPPIVVGLSGLDYLVLDGLDPVGFAVAGGSLRWLGDRWWSTRGADQPEAAPGANEA